MNSLVYVCNIHSYYYVKKQKSTFIYNHTQITFYPILSACMYLFNHFDETRFNYLNNNNALN